MRVVLPWPPSVNTYWRHPTTGKLAGRHLISQAGRDYREEVKRLVRLGSPLNGRLSVTVMAHVPDKRKRDLDNLFKAIGDSLTHAGVWEDDSQIDLLTIARCEQVSGGMIVVDIEEIKE